MLTYNSNSVKIKTDLSERGLKKMENIKEVRYCCECKADLQDWEYNVCNWCRRELAAKEKELKEKEEEENED